MPFWKCFACFRFVNEEIITKLDHSNCALVDVPPDVSQHERTLEELYLSSNRICALSPELFYCQGLKLLHVNDNELESLPTAIGSLKQLQSLNLSRNGISGVPDNIKSCKNLTHLDLSLNNLQRLPDAITTLISLQELLLNETNLEFLPANFGRLVNLRILELRSNNLITLPKSMSRLTNLNRIDIGANEFTELPEVICQLSQLKELWIDVNRIRHISPNVSNLRELKHFEANSNLLTTLPNEISYWCNLEVLSIATNDMESLPFSIGMLKSLITLQCDANHLRELPDSICHLQNLEEMVISHNFILRLPSTIGMMRKLRFLCADENVLRTLPDEICSCINLAVLSVRNNKITELPQNIGHLINLHVLNLVDNFISYLPVSVLNLSKLTALWISDNQSQPLVPLQYLNGSTSSYLTCFMLPQQGIYRKIDVQANNNSDNRSTTSWLQHDKVKPIDVRNNNQTIVSSPHRILIEGEGKSDLSNVIQNDALASKRNCCMSNEDVRNFTLIGQNGSIMSPSRRICFADEVKNAEKLPSRLMRSPTPYPKELRLLAKFVRNNQSPIISASSGDANENNFQVNSSSKAVHPVEEVKEARVLLNPGRNSVVLKQIQNPDSLIYNQLDDQHFEPKSTQKQEIYKPTVLNESLFPQQAFTVNNRKENFPQIISQHQVSYQQHRNPIHKPAVDVQNDECYSHSFPMFEQQNPEELYDSPVPMRQQNTSPSILSTYSQQDHQHPKNIKYSTEISKPPPYHIACAFTKKSREDLLSYNTFRSQIQLQHVDDRSDSASDRSRIFEEDCAKEDCHESSHGLDSNILNGHDKETPCDNSVHGFNDNEFNVDHRNNNNHILDHTFSVERMESRIRSSHITPSLRIQRNLPIEDSAKFGLSLKSTQSKQLNGFYTSEHNLEADEKTHDYSLSGSRAPSRSNSTTAWLFGLHKNPTVKQVTIKREQTVGFEIQEKPDQGIFVCSVQPNTATATLLYVNDKLLEVDGYDFTKIRLTDAQKILDNSGPIINVMISRI